MRLLGAAARRALVARNVLRNALRPGYLPVMADKIGVRIREIPHRRRADAARAAYAARADTAERWARALDEPLWKEAVEASERLSREGNRRLAEVGLPMGGPADTALLYFLVRLRRPQVVVETGVAAGFSSLAILTAMEENGTGELFSSDFPYVRLEDPERAIGCAVPPSLRGRWHLYLDGDRRNLRRIVAEAGPIDLFHYDSDKSFVGRSRALSIVAPRLRTGAAVVFDDIGDNDHFLDLSTRLAVPYRVFAHGKKFVGFVPAW